MLSLEEALTRQAENMAWSKRLRVQSSALVNSRLAKDISLDDYAASRKQAHEDATECRRRSGMLNGQINQLMSRSTI